MPEMKRNFTSGKMNKDLDERLVPQGEYRDAMNIEVSTSDSSNAGTIQNISGNIPGCYYDSSFQYVASNNANVNYLNQSFNPIKEGSKTVASVSDEKNNSLYWFVAGPAFEVPTNLGYGQDENNQTTFISSESFKDMIMRTNSDVKISPSRCQPVLVDQWAYCAANTSTETSTDYLYLYNWDNSNSYVYIDESMYSNIRIGMEVTGTSWNLNQATGQNVLTQRFISKVVGIGSKRRITATYQSGSTSVNTSGTNQYIGPQNQTTGLRLRSWDNGNSCEFVDSMGSASSANTAASEYPPPAGQHQFWYPAEVVVGGPQVLGQPTLIQNTPPTNLVVGSTLKITNSESDNNIGNPQVIGGPQPVGQPTIWAANDTVTVTNIQLVTLDISPCIGGGTKKVYLIDVDGYDNDINLGPDYTDFVASDACGAINPTTGLPYSTAPQATLAPTFTSYYDPFGQIQAVDPNWYGCTDPTANNYSVAAYYDNGTCAYCTPSDSQLFTYTDFDVMITSPDVLVPVPNNRINIIGPTFSMQSLAMGVFLRQAYDMLRDGNGNVIPNVALKIDNNSPAGKYFLANSCVDANTFTSPTQTYLDIVDCDDSTIPNNAQGFNRPKHPLTFDFIGDTNSVKAIILSDSVDLSEVDTVCFKSERILKFDPKKLITGVNIIDDLLFWTDNFTEPKKINVNRSIKGTHGEGDRHTALINTSTELMLVNNEALKEDHITVIRKGPKHPLALDLETGRQEDLTYAGVINTCVDPDLSLNINTSSIVSSSNESIVYDFSSLEVGDTVRFVVEQDVEAEDYNSIKDFSLNWQKGDFLLLKEFVQTANATGVQSGPDLVPLADPTIRCVITDWDGNNFVSNNPSIVYGNQWENGNTSVAIVEVEVLSIKRTPQEPTLNSNQNELKFVVDVEQKIEHIFTDKFPRFSYRYKYQDGEYSVFAPWSDVAFVAGNFNFDAKHGWNSGMINNVTTVKLQDFTNNIPLDVSEIDILYKEEGSPNVYIVETISPLDPSPGQIRGGRGMVLFTDLPNSWYANEYIITSETIKSAVTSNQLLRPWDNVPKKALAQEITGNRIVYGNYEQNYDLGNYKPKFKSYITSWANNPMSGGGKKSIKSLRDYKLGVVFTDKQGRETPILIGDTGGFKIDKSRSSSNNRLVAGLVGDPPNDVEYFKFFVKETSTEYYNLAMDRWYNAEDGNIWLAFPSSDRNKIDIDTTLYLKKGDSEAVENNFKHKILAIENEAPAFIKTRKVRIGTVIHNSAGGGGVFGVGLGNAPNPGGVSFAMDYEEGRFGSSSLSNLDSITDDLYVSFFTAEDGKSPLYKISKITSNRTGTSLPTSYFVTIEESFKNNINFIFDNPLDPSTVKDNVSVQITQGISENSPKFEGRFFVKIANDGSIKLDVNTGDFEGNYVEISTKPVYLLEDRNPKWYGDWSNGILGISPLRKRSVQAWYHPYTLGTGNQLPLHEYFAQNGFPTNWITFANANSSSGVTLNANQKVEFGTYPTRPHDDSVQQYMRLNARQCFFGQIPTTTTGGGVEPATYFDTMTDFGVAPTDKSRPGLMNGESKVKSHGYGPDGPRPKFEGVWFIDKSHHNYIRSEEGAQTDDLVWFKSQGPIRFDISEESHWINDQDNGNIPQPEGIVSNTSINSSTMDLSFGGFGYNLWTDGTKSDEDSNKGLWKRFFNNSFATAPQTVLRENTFFDIGGTNEEYSQENLFVSRVNPGLSFKWKEDPSGTIYTISMIRDRNVSAFHKESQRLFDGESDTTLGGVDYDGYDYRNYNAKIYTKHFVTNPASYIKNWKITVEPEMKWNPVGTVGTPIVGGLKLGEQFNEIDNCVVSASNPVITVPSNSLDSIELGMTVHDPGSSQVITNFSKVINIDRDAATVTLSEDASGTSAGKTLEFGFTIRFVNSNSGGITHNFTNWSMGQQGDPYIVVDNIQAGCANNTLGRYRLHKGMRLLAYNGPSASGTAATPSDDEHGYSNCIIKHISKFDETLGGFKITLTGYTSPLIPNDVLRTAFSVGKTMVFDQVTMNSVSNNTEKNTDICKNYWEALPLVNGNFAGPVVQTHGDTAGIGAVGYELMMLEPVETYEDGGVLPPNPYVWETEPKEDSGLDIYYEISENNPIYLNSDTISVAIPIGSSIEFLGSGENRGTLADDPQLLTVTETSFDNIITLSRPIYVGGQPLGSATYTHSSGNIIHPVKRGDYMKITRPSGVIFKARIEKAIGPFSQGVFARKFQLKTSSLYSSDYYLNWHNCFSFGNGVESNRIRDNYNLPFILNGVKASTTLEDYKEERREYGLIYSGIYNSTSGVNNLNQFIQAEKITKDLNPSYGSIQKLHAGWGSGGDLIALCEDRVLKILANKDALYNADGNPNVVATDKVLGTATPYAGKNGISKNPESFASHSYRAYFTDKVRGKVMRLSKDGLTAISDAGMRDWFRDNLKFNATNYYAYPTAHSQHVDDKLIGSYDDKKQEYNLTIKVMPKPSKTITYREDVKGWVSFKSYIPEIAKSCNNEYYTFEKGNLWIHHNERIDRNNFYGAQHSSSLKVILNESPGDVKTFHSLNYEGSQSKVDKLLSYDTYDPTSWDKATDSYTSTTNTYVNNEHYNLKDEVGWFVRHIKTDMEEGSLNEFIKKEGKWFNYIKGKAQTTNKFGVGGFDSADISFQGIGILQSGQDVQEVYGCMDPTAFNYSSTANVDNGTCEAVVNGCTDTLANNYDPAANTSAGCIFVGCMDNSYQEYNLLANDGDQSVECVNVATYGCTDATTISSGTNFYPSYINSGVFYGSCNDSVGPACINNQTGDNCCCEATVLGCTDNTMLNYNASANTDDGSCISVVFGCTDSAAANYDNSATTDDGTCYFTGCTDPTALNYNSAVASNGGTDDGSCYYDLDGCTDPLAYNYDANATTDDGTCIAAVYGCTDSTAYNYDSAANIDDNSCENIVYGCTDPTQVNYSALANTDDGTCAGIIVNGCTDPNADNYDSNANTDDGSCTYPTVTGCTDATANNYNPLANTDDNSCTYDVTGCTDPAATNYDAAAVVDNGLCTYDILGCTDPAATNYDASANNNDGSCTYPSTQTYSLLISSTAIQGKIGIPVSKGAMSAFLQQYIADAAPLSAYGSNPYGNSYQPQNSPNFNNAFIPSGLFKLLRNGQIVRDAGFFTSTSSSLDIMIKYSSSGTGNNGDFVTGDELIGPGHPDY
tara:strand:- start:1180 stop:10740 length:9561 start_codon:yes stop_codon:yes gene_type:complete